ncbi:MAG: oligosaccharide flippase family protein [Promethearchaeota archaeon]
MRNDKLKNIWRNNVINSFAITGFLILFFIFSKNFLTFLYQIVMGRLLSPSEFGLLSALLSILAILTIPYKSITIVAAKKSSLIALNKTLGAIKSLFINILRFIFPFFIGIGLLLLIFSPFIATTLKFETEILIFITVSYVFSTVINPVIEGIFQGMENTNRLGFSLLLFPGIRLVIGLLLVLYGFGVVGAIWGIIIAGFCTPILLLVFVSPYFYTNREDFPVNIDFQVIFPVLITDIGFILFFNLDILLIRIFFSTTESGYYAILSTIGRIVLYSATAFIIVMIPKAVKAHESRQDVLKVLKTSLLISLCLSMVVYLSIFFMGEFFVLTIFGELYRPAIAYLPFFTLVFLLYGVVAILINYNVALNNYSYNIPLFLGIIFEVIGIILFHDSLSTIFLIMFFSVCFMIFGIISMILVKRDQSNNRTVQ